MRGIAGGDAIMAHDIQERKEEKGEEETLLERVEKQEG